MSIPSIKQSATPVAKTQLSIVMSDSKTHGVTSVIVIPKNEKYARYIVNDGSVHYKRYDDLLDFLRELVPRKKYKIVLDFIRRFRTFVVLVDEQKVEELHFDSEAELQRLRRETVSEIMNPKKIEVILRRERMNSQRRDIRSQADALGRKFMSSR